MLYNQQTTYQLDNADVSPNRCRRRHLLGFLRAPQIPVNKAKPEYIDTCTEVPRANDNQIYTRQVLNNGTSTASATRAYTHQQKIARPTSLNKHSAYLPRDLSLKHRLKALSLTRITLIKIPIQYRTRSSYRHLDVRSPTY